jgi:hypothetical protein
MRYRGIIVGGLTVSSDIFAIAKTTAAIGAPVELAFNGSVITGLSGLTAGQKLYLNLSTGAIGPTDTGFPVYRAITATSAVAQFKF